MAADTIKLPGAGPVNRKVVLVAGAVGVGVVGYAWWTRKPEAIPEEVVTEGELDAIGDERIPTTGVPYDPNIGAPDTGITTNAQWTQFATDRLGTLGYDPIVVGDALGKFIGRQPLTPAEANIARAAIAQAGQPPQGGPWPVLEHVPAVPASVGLSAPILTSTLPAWRSGAWEYRIAWAPVPGATRYWFSHVGGSSGYISATQTATIRAGAGRVDTWKIAAVNAANVKGPEATLAKTLPPAPGGGTTAGAKPGAIPGAIGLLPTAPARFGIAFNRAPGATSYRYRWVSRGRGSAWASTTSTRFGVTWRLPRGTPVQVEVVPVNRAGNGPAKRSNMATAK